MQKKNSEQKQVNFVLNKVVFLYLGAKFTGGGCIYLAHCNYLKFIWKYESVCQVVQKIENSRKKGWRKNVEY